MKGFLLDENVPGVVSFTPSLPLIHATDISSSASDSALWEHAKRHALVIITKDTDFSNRIILTAPPPWVVHLRFGNLRRKDYHDFLASVWPRVEEMLPGHKLVNVYLDRIEGLRGGS